MKLLLADVSDAAGATAVGFGMVILIIFGVILAVTWIAFPFIVKKRLDRIIKELGEINNRGAITQADLTAIRDVHAPANYAPNSETEQP